MVPGNVIDRHRSADNALGLGIIHLDGARIGQFGQPQAVLFQMGQVRFRRDCHRNHLPAFFRMSNGVDLYARAGLLQQAHVFINLF